MYYYSHRTALHNIAAKILEREVLSGPGQCLGKTSLADLREQSVSTSECSVLFRHAKDVQDIQDIQDADQRIARQNLQRQELVEL